MQHARAKPVVPNNALLLSLALSGRRRTSHSGVGLWQTLKDHNHPMSWLQESMQSSTRSWRFVLVVYYENRCHINMMILHRRKPRRQCLRARPSGQIVVELTSPFRCRRCATSLEVVPSLSRRAAKLSIVSLLSATCVCMREPNEKLFLHIKDCLKRKWILRIHVQGVHLNGWQESTQVNDIKTVFTIFMVVIASLRMQAQRERELRTE